MEATWTPWARARLLPFPGEPWKVDSDASGALTAEQAAALAKDLRVAERYNDNGNTPKPRFADGFVDACVAAGGVAFATEALIAACGQREDGRSYELPRDATPWGRLREHLAVASEHDHAAAKAVAAGARAFEDERRQAVAFAFCDPAWVAEDLEGALENGYGQLSLLASLETSAQARGALERLLGKTEHYAAAYQLVEEAPDFVPNLIRRLDDGDERLVVEAARQAWNKQLRKPWIEIVACLPGRAAKKFLAEYGEVPPAKTSPAKKSPAKKPAAKKKPAKKPAAKKR